MVAEFRRNLNTDDSRDKVINQVQKVLWASHNTRGWPADHMGDCGSMMIDFSASSSCEVVAQTSNRWCDSAAETFCLEWALSADKSSIDITMIGKATGYISMGITDSPGRMYPADSIVCSVSGGVGRIEDGFMDSYLAPSAGENQDTQLLSATENGGVTTCKFRRPTTASDAKDRAIKVVGSTEVIWAIHSTNDDHSALHTARGGSQVDFSVTGASPTLSEVPVSNSNPPPSLSSPPPPTSPAVVSSISTMVRHSPT